jgi:hypothetical protein
VSRIHTLSRRVARLESVNGRGIIPIWCDDPADVSATIEDMLARGEIEPRDVERCICVCWTEADAVEGRHEQALAEMDAMP